MSQASRHDVRTGADEGGADTGDHLPAALRACAVAAAEAVGGGVALLFVGDPGSLRLRTAAGFPSPAAARSAAGTLAEKVQAAARADVELGVPVPAFGERGAAGTAYVPLVVENRRHGVLAVGAPRTIDPDRMTALAGAAELAACRLDHAHLAQTLHDAKTAADEHSRAVEEKSDEVLKLSEALFAQDIELLRSHEKLGKIEKLKNDFIEKMSRELRTPLNSIIEAIISVLAGENEHLSEGAKTSLRSALDEGTAFLRTLQNILDLWRIKQGELPVEIQEVNFREVVDEAIFSVQDTLGDKPIAIQKEFGEPFPKIRTDLAKINQILFLVLDNAVKFTERGEIHIRSQVSEGTLVCEIEDTGIGICPDDQQFAFDEFYQVDELGSTKYRGSGLGLALVRDLLVLLDGGLSLTSDVGKGTRFSFHVPVQVIT